MKGSPSSKVCSFAFLLAYFPVSRSLLGVADIDGETLETLRQSIQERAFTIGKLKRVWEARRMLEG
jgi:hypothetical protein